MFSSAIIVAAGSGKRLGSSLPKQFLKLNSKPILSHTIEKFENCCFINEIIVVVPFDYLDHAKSEVVNCYKFEKVKKVIPGGDTRQSSVFNGLKEVDDTSEIVVIHDGARPFVSTDDIAASIECAKTEGACIIGVKAKNTIKSVELDGFVADTLIRDSLYEVQTPQTFKRELITAAYENSEKNGFFATDDSALVERLGAKVKIIDGSYKNIKITTEEDLLFAKMILSEAKDVN
ncbi:MAG: 2-C-methyl-D-erythritol 4-phosphate cytidylyltransferase [Defluviitaleaceae bacterium]|nr:2-C-methyl-D-erythritol 4-phosphate cytidylyltransferase [Defluviitaleaceae bacterium]